jgi:hypothetical protein
MQRFLSCDVKGTHVKIRRFKNSDGKTDFSLYCTGTQAEQSVNSVTVQGIGAPGSSSKPYPNTVEVTVGSVECSGASNPPVDPQLGSTIGSFECKNGQPPNNMATVKVIAASKNPAHKVAPYIPGGSTTKPVKCTSNSRQCDICDNGTCADSAADPNASCDKQGCDLIGKYVNPLINLLSLMFGLIAVASLIFGGIQYSSSAGDPQKAGLAKKRISNTILAVIMYLFLYSFLQFLIPGGAF